MCETRMIVGDMLGEELGEVCREVWWGIEYWIMDPENGIVIPFFKIECVGLD